MNLELWLDGAGIMTALEPKRIVETSVQFMSKVNNVRYKSDL